jgi:hypothetical protein
MPSELLQKLSTRNIIALSVTAIILGTAYQMITNPDRLIVTLKENQEFVIGGAVIFGVILAKWADITQFYFRKPQTKESIK